MGIWGSGNFQDDHASDYLADVTHGFMAEIEAALTDPENLRPDENDGAVVPCKIDILVLLSKQGWGSAALPSAVDAQRWKATFMPVWEESIDGLGPGQSYKEARRNTLLATFDSLIAASTSRERRLPS